MPDAGTGILVSDGVSRVSGALTENIGGTVCQFTLSGTYTMNSDGTGSIQVTSTPITTGCLLKVSPQASVFFNMGTGAVFINTGKGESLGILTKQ
jgi:hypothetical protein